MTQRRVLTYLPLLALLLALPPGAPAQPHAPVPAPVPESDTWDYRIERGDTLIGLHRRLMLPHVDWRDIQRINRITNPRRLRPGSALQIPVEMLRTQDASAELLYVRGDVRIEREGASVREPQAGDTLVVGDLLLTGPQSSATVRFADGTRVLVRPDSGLRIYRHARLGDGSLVDTRVHMDQGGVDTSVPVRPAPRPRFELRTPVANLGVRGTDFRARSDAARTYAEVLSGEVFIADQRLGAGFGTLASATGAEPARVLMPAPRLARVPARIERMPLALPFDASGAATRWRAQVFEAAAPGRLMLDGVFERPIARWQDDLPDGRYELRVRAVDDDGLEGRDASIGFTLKARPEPPFLVAPVAGERSTASTFAFAWTRNPDAARYHLQIADDPDFVSPRLDLEDLTATEWVQDLPVGTHHWRLRSVRADGDAGPWSATQPLTRVPEPPAPAAEPPQQSPQGVMLRWAPAPGDGVRYRLQVAQDAGFTEVVLDETTADTSWLLRQPDAGTYHVRVKSISADGFEGPFGTTQEVDVPRSFQWWWLLPLLLFLL